MTPTPTEVVLVTGGRAKTGAPAVDLLAEAGVRVRAGSTRPGRLPLRDGVEPVTFNWDDPAGWPGAVAEVANLLGDALGRPVRAKDPSADEAVAGMDPWLADLNRQVIARNRAGTFAPVTEAVGAATGRAPRTMHDFVDEHVGWWRRLRPV